MRGMLCQNARTLPDSRYAGKPGENVICTGRIALCSAFGGTRCARQIVTADFFATILTPSTAFHKVRSTRAFANTIPDRNARSGSGE